MTLALFPSDTSEGSLERIDDGVLLLRRYTLDNETALLADLQTVIHQAPLRHMITPGGQAMSVAMSNCGPLGWVTDCSGYRYDAIDPISKKAWPAMPVSFQNLARTAAKTAGFHNFEPDACLINHYQPGARMGLHQDKDEADFTQPIVSVSLGLPAVFLFGGMKRADKTQRIPLQHGDVVVWGGPSRLRYHGVLALKKGMHHLLGKHRFNLTFRKAT
jgi:DNA oxidative demethylase